MLKIGLTGGIGSGKSTVAKYFKQLGATVIDADQIVHQLLRTRPIIKKITARFGNTVLKNSQLDHHKIRAIVFNSAKKRRQLEKLLHPLVYQKLKHLSKISASYVILVIPLLIETQKTKLVDRILVVDSTQKTRLQRLRKRDQSSAKLIKQIMRIQCSRNIRLKAADDIIINNDTLSALKKQVRMMHKLYLKSHQF